MVSMVKKQGEIESMFPNMQFATLCSLTLGISEILKVKHKLKKRVKKAQEGNAGRRKERNCFKTASRSGGGASPGLPNVRKWRSFERVGGHQGRVF